MPCPFGFKADDQEEDPLETQGQHSKSDADKAADETSWFYKNQTKADKEALERKRKKQDASKQRLETIMSRKNKQVTYEQDLDSMSIASSELSELNSEVHSMGSLRSCAESWMEDKGYKAPAEAWVKSMVPGTLVATVFALFQAYDMQKVAEKDPAHTINTRWPAACAAVALALVPCAGVLYFAAAKRSKSLLLGAQAALLVLNTAAAALTAYAYASPVMIDPNYMEASCAASQGKHASRSQAKTPACKHALAASRPLTDAFPWFFLGCLVVALAAVWLLSLGLWYLFELAFIEKKAAKHMKRHRHHKHRIPWHKIKVIGPTMTCGQNAGGAGHGTAKGAKAGGKCPVMH